MMKAQKMLKNSKKVWAGKRLHCSVITASVLIISALWSAPGEAAQAQAATNPTHMQKMVYEVYAGGINAVATTLNVSYSPAKEYSLELAARTQGFLGRLAPWQGTFETKGWSLKDGERPELHKSIAVWRDEEEVKEYKYGKDGSFKGLTITEEGIDKTPDSIDNELTQGTTDALTATFEVMKSLNETGKCEGSSEVFDGKRRFKMVFNHEENVMLQATRYNVYEGPASICTVEVKPVAGPWHKKPRGWMSIQEQGREKGTMPTIWMAQMSENAPAIPIKVRVKTSYGTLFMHLVGYDNGEKKITLDER